jgi:hypothetical protein
VHELIKVLALDPGDIHVGFCYDGGGDTVVGEWRPDEAVDEIVWLMTRNMIDEVVVERFSLYADKAEEQIGSAMKTSQLIGGVKVICRFFRIGWVEQGADIKVPTRNQLRARRIHQKGIGSHARDAELHYHYRQLRRKH